MTERNDLIKKMAAAIFEANVETPWADAAPWQRDLCIAEATAALAVVEEAQGWEYGIDVGDERIHLRGELLEARRSAEFFWDSEAGSHIHRRTKAGPWTPYNPEGES